MLTKKDAVIGKRVKWRSSGATEHPCFGTIVAVKDDGEVVVEYDDGGIGSTYIDNVVSTVYPAQSA